MGRIIWRTHVAEACKPSGPPGAFYAEEVKSYPGFRELSMRLSSSLGVRLMEPNLTRRVRF